MKNTQSHQLVLIDRCEYLGLKEDAQTCLAFPSTWNYCHHVKPPESIRLDYQRQYCQSHDHVQCQIFQNEKVGSLPSDVRGRHNQKKLGVQRFVRILVLLLVLFLVLIFLWLAQSSSLLVGIGSNLFEKTSVYDPPFDTIPALSFVVGTPFAQNPLITIAPAPEVVSTSTITFIPPGYSSNIPASQTFISLPVSPCGHPLDVTFGKTSIFIIHQAKNGESLNMYEDLYNTSVNAILAVNYQMTLPLRKGRVLVIPVGETNVKDLPVFEIYKVSETDSSIEKLASQLSTDPAELKRFNNLDESCRAFFGWLLIPHQRPTP